MQFALPLAQRESASRSRFASLEPLATFLFGVIAPAVALTLATSRNSFGEFSLAIDAFAAVSLAVLSTWLVFGRRSARFDAFAAGALFAGAACSIPFLIYVIPTAPSLLFGLVTLDHEALEFGALGAIPLACSALLLRHAWLAERASIGVASVKRRAPWILCGVLAPIAAAALVWNAMSFANAECLRSVAVNDDAWTERWVERMHAVPAAVDERRWVDAWFDAIANDDAHAARIAEVYRRITGGSIELAYAGGE